jgi:hypothetical protein
MVEQDVDAELMELEEQVEDLAMKIMISDCAVDASGICENVECSFCCGVTCCM